MQVRSVAIRLTRMLALKWVTTGWVVCHKGDTVNGAFKAQGVQLTAKLGYPVTDDLDVYTVWAAWYGALTPATASLATTTTLVFPQYSLVALSGL